MKNKPYIIELFPFFISLLVIGFILTEFYFESKYDSTKLNINYTVFIAKWGTPQNRYVINDSIEKNVLFYQSFLGISEKAFIFDFKKNILIEKQDLGI